MEFLILLAAVVVLILIWRKIAGFCIRKGHKSVVSHCAGAVCGILAFLIVLVLMFELIRPGSYDSDKRMAKDSPHQASNETRLNPSDHPDPKVPAKTNDDRHPVTENTKAPHQKDKTLAVTPEKFRTAFNKIISQINTNYKLAEFDIDPGVVNDTFNIMIGNNMSMVGSVNKKNKTLQGLVIIATLGGTPNDSLRTLTVILVSTQVLNTTIEKSKNGQVVLDMVQAAISNIKSGKPEERRIGKLLYTASATEVAGLMFTISQP